MLLRNAGFLRAKWHCNAEDRTLYFSAWNYKKGKCDMLNCKVGLYEEKNWFLDCDMKELL
jgi:hypothetical protein